MSDFNLSSKKIWKDIDCSYSVIPTDDVKEFIRLLKEGINCYAEPIELIDKLAGEELTKPTEDKQ